MANTFIFIKIALHLFLWLVSPSCSDFSGFNWVVYMCLFYIFSWSFLYSLVYWNHSDGDDKVHRLSVWSVVFFFFPVQTEGMTSKLFSFKDHTTEIQLCDKKLSVLNVHDLMSQEIVCAYETITVVKTISKSIASIPSPLYLLIYFVIRTFNIRSNFLTKFKVFSVQQNIANHSHYTVKQISSCAYESLHPLTIILLFSPSRTTGNNYSSFLFLLTTLYSLYKWYPILLCLGYFLSIMSSMFIHDRETKDE